jgi:thiopeptide-type bacteriocin biosynthesis protein
MTEYRQPTLQQMESFYLPADFYMVRAPSLPARVFLQMASAGHVRADVELDEALLAGIRACTDMLLQMATQPTVMQAMAIASPSLMDGLELVRSQREETKPVRRARVYAGLLRYLIRMSTRPTPFGLFAGVETGSFAEHTDLRLGETALAGFRTRPDMHWLLTLLKQIESTPALVAQLQVRLNQTAYLVGERAVLPFIDTYGREDNRTVSLRATVVVREIFALAQQYIPYAELGVAIQQAFPRATGKQIEEVLWQLWRYGFLISSLHPPLTDAKPAEYVRAHLETLRGVDEIRARLTRVLEGAHALDQGGIGAPVHTIAALVQEQSDLGPIEHSDRLPLQVDSILQIITPTLHRSIGQAAARAAMFLLRQSSLPTGSHHLQKYRALFLDTYGEQAEVPLLDLLSPENGLDAPSGYAQPPRTYDRPLRLQPPAASSRDQVLLRLVTETVNQHRLEVELTEELQQQLERWSPGWETAPLSLEIYLQLHAESREAIDRGEWTAMVGRTEGSQGAGRTFGRFFDLLGEQGLERLNALAGREEALRPDIIFAELSYQPQLGRVANLTIRPPVRSYEIAVGTTPSVPAERVLTLSDLVVGVHNGRFYLRSLRLGKQVRVCQSHMVNSTHARNVCRFLTDVASDGLPTLSPFDWGALTSAPFLPRLVMKIGPTATLVITPACWQLQAGTIVPSGEGSEEARWFRGLQRWREQWHVPRYVYLTDGDNRLLLDLEHALMVMELRDELRKLKDQEQVVLDELLPDFEHLWLRDAQNAGYFSEIVIPLLRAETSASLKGDTAQTMSFTPQEQVIPSVERRRFPGEDWVYLKWYAAFSQHEELLAGPMRDLVSLLQERELIDRWFFIRYIDPEPHLRLRFHARDAASIQPVLALALPWSARLARSGQLRRFTLDTYDREVERYGGPRAIDLLEQVFHVDSVLVGEIIASQRARHLTLDPQAVAVFTLDSFFGVWGYDWKQRQEWTHQTSEQYAYSKEFHARSKRYCDLLAPGGQFEADLAEQRELLLNLVCPRDASLRTLGIQVRQLARAGTIHITENRLLSSLAHMHVNRLLGVDREKENQVYAFWRQTLDALARRPAQDHAPTKQG